MSLGDQRDQYGNWIDTPVRDKNGRSGRIVSDFLWADCFLGIRFDDASEHKVVLRSTGPDRPDPLGVQWEFNPGQWARLADGRVPGMEG
jgi:hypothetical protein